ncbi:MAG: hypothetical protein JSW51_10570 [Gemmatimonadota bacterium]|nr:MAG: hypothetical protein JSW51_10570 [Gemmatimonadota bacterium]
MTRPLVVALWVTMHGGLLSAQGGIIPASVYQPVSVRSAGLNGAAAALVGDAGAVFSNPAALATIRHISLEGAYRGVPSSGMILNGALAWRIRQFHLAFGGAHLDHGTDPTYYPTPGIPEGSNVRERLGTGSLVYRFGMLAFGGTVRYVRFSVDDQDERAWSGDAGVAIAVFDILAFGFSIQNIGGNWKEESLLTMPRLTRFGFTMNYVDPQESFRLLSTIEFQWPEGYSSRFVGGVEAGIVLRGVGVIGRGAYGSQPSGTEQSKFTAGGSLVLSRFALDYAYQPEDNRGNKAHRVGMRITL